MKKKLSGTTVVIACSLAMSALAGCATVQPWEKGNLARQEMTFSGDKLETMYIEHIYSSKEAASGGSGVGGGGCGCN